MEMWIEFDDGAARWDNVSEENLDLVLAYAASVLGQPDTIV